VECTRCRGLFQVFSTAQPNGNSDMQCKTRPHPECYKEEQAAHLQKEDLNRAKAAKAGEKPPKRQTFNRNTRVERDSLDDDNSDGQVRAQDKKTPFYGSEYPVGP
jgi:hypothetical protein